MSFIDLEGALRRQAAVRSGEIPANVARRIEETLRALPDRNVLRKKATIRKWTCTAAAVCMLGGGLFVSAALSGPSVKSEIRKVPVVGSLIPADPSETGQSVTDHGITFTIRDVLYDGRALYIDYEIESDRDMDGYALNLDLKMDGVSVGRVFHDKTGNRSSVSVTGQTASPRRSSGIIKAYLSAYRPGAFRMELAISRIGKENGKWSLTRDVNMTSRMTVIESGKKVASGLFDLELDQFSLSPVSSEISYKISAKDSKAEKLMVGFQVVGDRGEVFAIESVMIGNGFPWSNETQKNIFGPVSEGTRYLTIRPFYHIYSKSEPNYGEVTRVEMKKIPSEEEPIVLSQGEAGKLYVTKVEYFQDRTIVRYRTEGTNPLQQSQLFWAERENGSRFETINQTLPNLNGKENILEIGPVSADAKLYFATRPSVPLTFLPDMQIRVDLPQ
ncbi:DUF4179 domain-containing protein [Cohnella sp. CFH 77786]|uniref:DUF4179 domain-containing protein n=1 Tax=Cohnella sp. CFH 77786 TaxID=2662265 RepID=UPI001C60F2B7|nr:DUF4179 domain-containing protein [Cohnella sp. CFH 77786]